ncbi:uncharacterized protein LOC105687730 [Athalia rosae]|uniref:uncharacterized protein LOC105687730 n=1 Tax=Athalia rosae TaxID=37344 RepID=UPI0020334471|nr:uncharacterized protein LOC105687730 [Athalia rosae]
MDTTNIYRAEKSEISQEDKIDRWKTVTNDSYVPPPITHPRILGRRRELMKTFLTKRVSEEIVNETIAEPSLCTMSPSEYVDNFCDSKFTPFMDRTECNTQKHLKYPLYGGATAQSYYKSQLDRGTLRVRSEIKDFNEPFRRSCSFTTPPDLALREPTGGY